MNKKKYYKKIFEYFKEEKKLIIIYSFLSILLVLFNTISPVVGAKSLTAITNTNLNDMLKYAILIFLIQLVEAITHFYNTLNSKKLQNNVELKIKKEISGEIFNLETKNFDKEGTGFFINRIEREPSMLSGIFSRLRYEITSLLTSLGILIYIFWVAPIFGIFFMITSVILFILSVNRTKSWEKESKDTALFEEKHIGNFSELIRGIKDIKVLNLKKTLVNRATKEQEEIVNYYYNINVNDQKYFFINDTIRYIIDFIFIVLGIILIKYNHLSGAVFLIIYMYKYKALYFVDYISSIYRTVKEFNVSLERLYEVVDGNKYKRESFGIVKKKNLEGKIEFINTHFAYDDKEVLKGINFTINPNETIGIVGKSGAGKSTIFNLINRLYTVDAGQIFIDGVDINDLNEESIRENIATIMQNPYIFNLSIKENLQLVNSKLTDKEMIKKCKECLLDEYVQSLDQKYDTVVGENGVILSGGLKQRLAIARALVKNSKIILLDEATSSLDNETQDYIHNSIKKIRNDYTILIIAHRLSTVIDCDKILVIDDGKVVGFDTHDNLIKNNKVYQKLYKKELV